MQQHVFLPDCCKHIAFVVLNTLGDAGCEGWPEKLWLVVTNQFTQIGKADHAFDLDDFVFAHMQFALNDLFQRLRCAGRNFQADHFTPAATFQGDFEFAHKVFGFFFNLKVAVAQDAEGTVTFDFVAWEHAVEVNQKQFFQRKIAVGSAPGGQRYKAVKLLRDRQKRLKGFATFDAL